MAPIRGIDGKYICRFGRKGAAYSLLQQVTLAYNHDMGITSTYMPYNPFNYLDQTGPFAGGAARGGQCDLAVGGVLCDLSGNADTA
jgi:hypothetical protein